GDLDREVLGTARYQVGGAERDVAVGTENVGDVRRERLGGAGRDVEVVELVTRRCQRATAERDAVDRQVELVVAVVRALAAGGLRPGKSREVLGRQQRELRLAGAADA